LSGTALCGLIAGVQPTRDDDFLLVAPGRLRVLDRCEQANGETEKAAIRRRKFFDNLTNSVFPSPPPSRETEHVMGSVVTV
jgi:hypothetical protein